MIGRLRWLVGLVALVVTVSACAADEPADRAAAGSTTSPTAGADDADPGDAPDLPEVEPFDPGGVELVSEDGTSTCSCVLVADTPQERSQGLMNVTDLQGYAGMVFVFEGDAESRFTMRDTPLPLSIAWFDADGSLVSTADMDPCLGGGDCPTYGADGPYRYALEVPQGDLEAVGATDGATFRLVDRCDP